MYKNTKWLDEIVDADTGEKLQDGTDQSALNFNNAEAGISDATAAAQLMLIMTGQTLDELAVEERRVTLTNTQKYPFNNSQQTISLNKMRNALTYSVEVEIESSAGEVGDIAISAKQLNGFKIKYDGSATTASLILRIKGGM